MVVSNDTLYLATTIHNIMRYMYWNAVKTKIWLKVENPLLGGDTPLEYWEKRGGKKLCAIVHAALEDGGHVWERL